MAPGSGAVWSFVKPQMKPVHGGRDFPSVRYSASAVSYRGEMIVTHGYFYNHAIRHPAWQSNAWAFNFASRRWRKVHDGETAGAPSARYSASAVLYEDALWMFGGDDGGHKKSMFNYIFQAWFNELWRFDLRTYTWRRVRPNGEAPPKRALHSAVTIGDSMYMYGGLELADTWRYDFKTATWTLLVPAPHDSDTKDGSHPGRRHAFAAAAAQGGFFIFGGCRHVRGLRPLAFNDLWHFKVADSTWQRLTPTDSQPTPSPRSHLSLVTLTDHTLLLYGGALCIPGCSCHGDSWVYEAATRTWTNLNATDAPIHRYRQSLVVHGAEGAVYLYGGESYQPYMYHNAVNRLQLPPAIAAEMIADAQQSAGGGSGAMLHGGGAGKHRGGGRFGGAQGRGVAELPTTGAVSGAADVGGQLAALVGGGGWSGVSPMSLAVVGVPLALVIGIVAWGLRSKGQREGRYSRYKPIATPGL